MKKLILFTALLGLAFTNTNNPQKKHEQTLSSETIKSLQAKGINVLGLYHPVRSPRMVDSTNLGETVHIKMSLNVNTVKNLDITWLGSKPSEVMTASPNDTILIENFEEDFPGTQWQLSGDPTWGKTSLQKHSGANSVWCAAGGTGAVSPGSSYPNDLSAMMVFGPFDLSDVNYGELKFWHWLDTEFQKDWFFYMVSTDGNNFSGIGLSGQTGFFNGAWTEEVLPLSNFPELGNVTGQSQVWLAFLFESDSNSTSDQGVYIDDITIFKRQINGTPIAGAISGTLTPQGNPYIAPMNVGVVEGEALEIHPGVEIRFEKGTEFVVLGSLNAIGASSDSILFTSALPNPAQGDWVGLGFYDSNDSSKIEYCTIDYGGYSLSLKSDIFIENHKVFISKSLIAKSSGAGLLCFGSSPRIVENLIAANNSAGISLTLGSFGTVGSPSIEENSITQNGSGIALFMGFAPKVINNTISNNKGIGISCDTSEPIITGNMVLNNGSDGISAGGGYLFIPSFRVFITNNQIFDNKGNGIRLSGLVGAARLSTNLIKGNTQSGIDFSGISNIYEDPLIPIANNTIVDNVSYGINCGGKIISNIDIINNIIVNNGKSGISSQESRFFHISYNNFFNNNPNFDLAESDSLGILSRTNNNGDPADKYFNILLDPLFVDESGNDLHLQSGSQCINAGNPTEFFNDTDGTTNDMGFYGGGLLYGNFSEYDFGKVVVGKSRKKDFSIENYRDRAVNLESFSLSETSNFSLSQSGLLTIPPFQSQNITVNYKPINVNNHQAILTINSNDFYGSGLVNITFRGSGINGTEVSGSVSGTWTRSGSPYILSGQVRVPAGQKLTIGPGVEVRFDGQYRFVVDGQLQAIGAPNDSIIFTRHQETATSEGEGLRFYSQSTADTNKLVYCIVQKMKRIVDPFSRLDLQAISSFRASPLLISDSRIYANNGAAIWADGNSLVIRNCVIAENGDYATRIASTSFEISHSLISGNKGSAVEIFSSRGDVRGCVIKNNSGSGIYSSRGKVTIENCTISNNISVLDGGAISTVATVGRINNNIILNNSAKNGGAIFFNSDTLLLTNNVIFDNSAQNFGGGLYKDFNNRPIVAMNNIIWNNKAPNSPQIFYSTSYGGLTLSYSNVQGGWQGEGNINNDPLFVDPENGNFLLQPSSPCIDAGDTDPQFNDIEDPNNPGFALHPSQGTVRNDMGAFGGPNVSSSLITSVEEIPATSSPISFELLQNYPNPFNPETTIKYQLPKEAEVKLVIYNILGQQVRILVDKKQPAGVYSVTWDGKDESGRSVTSGIYLYWLQTNEFAKVRKLTLLR